MLRTCSLKSKSISNDLCPYGMGEVVNPLVVTYSGICQLWFSHGVCARRIFPTICVQRCNVAHVSCHAAYGSAGQVDSDDLDISEILQDLGRRQSKVRTRLCPRVQIKVKKQERSVFRHSKRPLKPHRTPRSKSFRTRSRVTISPCRRRTV